MSIILLGSNPVCLWVNNLYVWNVLIANGIWWDRCMITKIATQDESHHGSMSWHTSWNELHVSPNALQTHQVDGQVAPSLTLRSLESLITMQALCVTGTLKNHVRKPLQGPSRFPTKGNHFFKQDSKPVARSNSMTTYEYMTRYDNQDHSENYKIKPKRVVLISSKNNTSQWFDDQI